MQTERLRQIDEQCRERIDADLPARFPAPERVTVKCGRCGAELRVQRLLGCRPPALTCQERMSRIEAEREATEEAARQARLASYRADPAAILRPLGVPERVLPATFDLCPDLPGELVEAARRWAERPDGFMVFTGPPGCGKSWLAVGVLRNVLLAGVYDPGAVRFIAEADYLERRRQAMAPDAGAAGRRGNPLASLPLLVFDDLGASRLTN